jgi:hypothetical protein
MTILGAAALLCACGGTQRPEGIVERWLASLDAGDAGRPDVYALPAVSDQLLPPPRDVGALDRAVVGQGARTGKVTRVPFEIEVDATGATIRRVALLRRTPDGWRIVGLGPADPSLPLPDEGGPRLGGLSPRAWALSGLAAIGFGLLAACALRLVGGTSGIRSSAMPGRPHPSAGSSREP